MKSYKAQGIVLHTIKYGDSSLVAHILTDEIGRQSYIVQGVKSSRGHGNKAAMLQPMFLIEFVGLETPHSQMDRMRDMRMSYPLQTVPFDVRKSTIALFMAEVLYKLIREVEPNSSLFEFIRHSVIALDEMESGIANFHLWFLARMSAFLGFYPSNEYRTDNVFDITNGSYTPTTPQHGIVIDKGNAQLLNRLLCLDVGELPTLQLSRQQRNDFLRSLLHYFGYHLDAIGRIQSLHILGEVF